MTLRTTFSVSGPHTDDHLSLHQRYNADIWLSPGDDIQAAIDAIGDAGAIVGLRPGTFVVSRAIEILRSNIRLIGSGMGLTVIDSTATGQLTQVNHTYQNYGTITIDSNAYGVGVSNCSVEHLTLNVSSADDLAIDQKGIFVGAAPGCRIDHVKIIGSKVEAIQHDDAGKGVVLTDWHVTNCEFTGHKSNAIDDNGSCDAFFVTGNYIHDGAGGGISVKGLHAVVTGNVIQRVASTAILCLAELPNGLYFQDAIIDNNVLTDVGIGNTWYKRYGIHVVASSNFANCGVIVANNIIRRLYATDGYDAAGILAAGPVTVSNNQVIDATGTGPCVGISVNPDPINAESVTVMRGNDVYATAEARRFYRGFTVYGKAYLMNNTVGASSFTDAAYYTNTSEGDVVLSGNIFP
jgi:hypothetical protein